MKAGIARAFKAPNLYQTSEGYLLYSKGNGCPKDITSGGCYLVGNKNLDPEISINKEIGLEFTVDDYHASVTYFRNDYQNKIVAGDKIIGRSASGAYVLQWQNGGKALIEGIEASMTVPLMPDRLNWNTNATYMIASEQKDTGNPLSIIPKYTVNTFLDWTITSALSANVNWTLYGKQKPRTHAESRSEETKGLSGKALGLTHWSALTLTTISIRTCVLMSVSAISSINRSIAPPKGQIPITNRGGLIMPV